jgi:site-specific recombinase XerD
MAVRTRLPAAGPLAGYGEELRAAMAAEGYAAGTVVKHVGLLAQLSGWMAIEGVTAAELTEEMVARFIGARPVLGYRTVVTASGLSPLLRFLHRAGLAPAAPTRVTDQRAEALTAFAGYLRRERRLAPLTVVTTVGVVRRFLEWLSAHDGAELSSLTPLKVHAFVLLEADRLSVGATRAVLSALRVFLRYLFAVGVLPADLAVTVPSVAGARFSGLARGVDAATVHALLAAAATGTAARRDVAVLTLQFRLGLRANEIADLRLDDIHWRAGELTVHGKGGRIERLPLPADVGAALVDYLRHERPVSGERAVFLRALAPPGPMSRNAVVMVSRTGSRRAGLPVVGGHRLRHTAATNMLRAGASLREVGQVLRHTSDTTTAVYASVDRAALDLVVRGWPEQSR